MLINRSHICFNIQIIDVGLLGTVLNKDNIIITTVQIDEDDKGIKLIFWKRVRLIFNFIYGISFPHMLYQIQHDSCQRVPSHGYWLVHL